MVEETKKERRERKRKFVRTAAGTVWEDMSLAEWEQGNDANDHIRFTFIDCSPGYDELCQPFFHKR